MSLHGFHVGVGQIDSKSFLACYSVSAEFVIWRESGGVCALGSLAHRCLLLKATQVGVWRKACNEHSDHNRSVSTALFNAYLQSVYSLPLSVQVVHKMHDDLLLMVDGSRN